VKRGGGRGGVEEVVKSGGEGWRGGGKEGGLERRWKRGGLRRWQREEG
jgi:hypothetical protein